MTSHTKTLSIEAVARILREHFNLPSNTNVDFIKVQAENLRLQAEDECLLGTRSLLVFDVFFDHF